MFSPYAIRTCQEVADILYERGLLKNPDRQIVSLHEQRAMEKIRKRFPELEDEIDDS